MFNEKIYIFLWLWISLVLLVSVLSLLTWLSRLALQRYSRNFLREFLAVSLLAPIQSFGSEERDDGRGGGEEEGVVDLPDDLVNKFLREVVRCDGNFMIRMLRVNAGDVVTGEILARWWRLFTQSEERKRRDLYAKMPDYMPGFKVTPDAPPMPLANDGTTANLLALLTGFFEQELPEARRFVAEMMPGQVGLLDASLSKEGNRGEKASRTVLDEFPWIWKEYASRGGYVTHYIEDTTNYGTFQYRLQGFGSRQTPVNSYGRPCLVAAAQDEARYGKRLGCTASTPTHKILLESMREFFHANAGLPRFSLTFLSEMIHEDPSQARLVDADLHELLQQIEEDDADWEASRGQKTGVPRLFANTLLVLFSDHGPRMGKARLSLQTPPPKMLGQENTKRAEHLVGLLELCLRTCSTFDVQTCE
nr:unnamed protein product [Spirometra erinaceieuropaei]